MYQKERIDKINEILKTFGYVTVKFLTKELDYSTATINRDLNLMEKQKLIKRTYGGVELLNRKYVPLEFRYNLMKSAKNKLGVAALSLVNDGDTVFIDGSTTCENLGRRLIEKKGISVITNNMALVMFLSERGINCTCLGGKVMELPYILGGETTVENAMKYNADICFFSTTGMSDKGIIYSSTYNLLYSTMIKNSKKVCYMAHSEKINIKDSYNLCDLNSISYILTDYNFNDNVKNSYPDTRFIEI